LPWKQALVFLLVERRPLEKQESGDLNFPGNTYILEKHRISEKMCLLAEYVEYRMRNLLLLCQQQLSPLKPL
jgi:hypothetical protein